jgi:hypothetical protein
MKLNGQADRRSKAFSIDSDKWRITWKTQPNDRDGEFIVMLYDQQNPGEPLIITNSPENDMSDVEGNGVYYLEVTSSQPYQIEITEFK